MATIEEIIQRALTGQSGLGKHPSQLSGSKIGMAPDPAMLRRGADTLEGRNFTGSISRAPMAGLNPTNAEAFGLGTMIYGNHIPWNDPGWMAPAYYGHDESMQYEMARMVAQAAAEQALRDQTTMGNVAAGSNNPISYPSPSFSTVDYQPPTGPTAPGNINHSARMRGQRSY